MVDIRTVPQSWNTVAQSLELFGSGSRNGLIGQVEELEISFNMVKAAANLRGSR